MQMDLYHRSLNFIKQKITGSHIQSFNTKLMNPLIRNPDLNDEIVSKNNTPPKIICSNFAEINEEKIPANSFIEKIRQGLRNNCAGLVFPKNQPEIACPPARNFHNTMSPDAHKIAKKSAEVKPTVILKNDTSYRKFNTARKRQTTPKSALNKNNSGSSSSSPSISEFSDSEDSKENARKLISSSSDSDESINFEEKYKYEKQCIICEWKFPDKFNNYDKERHMALCIMGEGVKNISDYQKGIIKINGPSEYFLPNTKCILCGITVSKGIYKREQHLIKCKKLLYKKLEDTVFHY